MYKNTKGVTLVETLISIFLVSALLVGVLGAFFISALSASHARHRQAALNMLDNYIAREIRAGYDADSGGDYYVTVSSGDPVSVLIDDRGTASTADDLMGTITPDPYYPNNVENADGTMIKQDDLSYKIIGFVISWTEDYTKNTCSERAGTYVVHHST